jgi:uncharacterized protein (DUF736 family)
MAYEMKDNTGSLFRNEKKETDNHPDHTGQIKIGGVEYWVSAWINESKSGQKYFGMKFKPKDEQRQAAPQGNQGGADIDDEIPF